MKPQMTNRLYVGLQKHILLLDLQRYERIPDRDTSVFGEIPSISAASLTVIYSLFVCIPHLDYFICTLSTRSITLPMVLNMCNGSYARLAGRATGCAEKAWWNGRRVHKDQ